MKEEAEKGKERGEKSSEQGNGDRNKEKRMESDRKQPSER